MDLNGGVLNLYCLQLLCSLETGNCKNVRNTLIPSTHMMQKVFKSVERMADEILPFQLKHLPDGEAIIFDYKKTFVTF